MPIRKKTRQTHNGSVVRGAWCGSDVVDSVDSVDSVDKPAPCTLHPSPFTLHPSPFTLHPSPFTLPPAPRTLHRPQKQEIEE